MRRLKYDKIRGQVLNSTTVCPNCKISYRLTTDTLSDFQVYYYLHAQEPPHVIARKHKGKFVCYKCGKKLGLFVDVFDNKPEPIGNKLKIKLGMI